MTDYPILNARVLNELGAELGLENATQVLRVFLADTARKVVIMASTGANRMATKREAHAIKGSAATLGFERLSQLARELESGAETLDATPLKNSISALQTAFIETAGFAENKLLPSLAELP
jgi:HPt (histidine-containing phosphotransfer) domain-containing protein